MPAPPVRVAVVGRIVTFVLVMSLSVMSGCGNSTPPPTTTATDGASVGSDRYLADAAAAADAVRAFSVALGNVGSPATSERLKAIAPELDRPLERAQLAGQRLAAERLADRRLDEQRARSAAGFAVAVDAMKRIRDAAAAGNALAAETASNELAGALAALGSAAAGP